MIVGYAELSSRVLPMPKPGHCPMLYSLTTIRTVGNFAKHFRVTMLPAFRMNLALCNSKSASQASYLNGQQFLCPAIVGHLRCTTLVSCPKTTIRGQLYTDVTHVFSTCTFRSFSGMIASLTHLSMQHATSLISILQRIGISFGLTCNGWRVQFAPIATWSPGRTPRPARLGVVPFAKASTLLV